MQGRGPLQNLLPPHFFGLAQRNGSGAPKKNAGRRPEAERAFSKREVAAKWSSREVNDVSHQNRALLPLVAALTGSCRDALVDCPSVPRAKRSKRTVGDAVNSFTIRDWNFSITKSLVKVGFRLRCAPKRFSLWSLRGFFLTRQKEISQKGLAGAYVPAIAPSS